MTVHVFGIRHHGPGCARSLVAALEELQPDLLLLEGPADAESLVPLVLHPELQPPVAWLVYAPAEPRRAVYYPFAEFSPEWQSMRWAAVQPIPVRLMDLPVRHGLALDAEAAKSAEEESKPPASPDEAAPRAPEEPIWRTDPLAVLAQAAGYTDHELWWEEQVERRQDPRGLFEAILQAMAAVREHEPEHRERDLLREAWMRTTIRRAASDGFSRMAVVCGAWHAPVLTDAAVAGDVSGCTRRDDTARVKSLPQIKVEGTWIPWTSSRLAYRSGYGAGIASPGWYQHLWEAGDRAPLRWLVSAARQLRQFDLDASSASVIEAVRLADALASLRNIRSPGLTELQEAILTVLCHGDPAPLHLIRERLEIGTRLGTVPQDAPTVPLARDLESRQKSLRLKPSAEIKTLDLDLRQKTDLERSQLLHQLNLLEIDWGQVQQSGGRTSTFHEIWRLQWQPEFAVRLIAANVWGNAVPVAASNRVLHDAAVARDLPTVTGMLDAAILAGLAGALDALLTQIQNLSAASADVRQMLESLLPLARVARYGDVRGTQAAHVLPVITGLFERACVGLPAACSSLDDDAAERMLNSMVSAQQSLDLLNRSELQEEWLELLQAMMRGGTHGLLRGWCCRTLLEKQRVNQEELYRATRLALSTATDALQAAAWITGLLRGSGLLLLHQDGLWHVLDHWVSELSGDAFQQLLPLLRRAFSGFEAAERRHMGEKLRHLTRARDAGTAPTSPPPKTPLTLHPERANLVLPVLRQILGITS